MYSTTVRTGVKMDVVVQIKYIFLTTVFVSLKQLGTLGAITLAPVNIAVMEGTKNATLMCSTDEDYLDWLVVPFISQDNSAMSLSSGGVLDSQYNETYAIDPFNAYNLVVVSATMSLTADPNSFSTAGIYQCYTPKRHGVLAQIVVIRSDPECQSTPVQIGETVQLKCIIVYAAVRSYASLSFPIDAILNWTSNGTPLQNASYTIDDSATEITATSVVSIDVSQATCNNFYECTAGMSRPANDPLPVIAGNAPNYQGRCHVSFCHTSIRRTPETSSSKPTASITKATAFKCPSHYLFHTVVYEGNSTSFKRLNNGQPVQWQVAPSSVTFYSLKSITNYDDTLATEFVHTYSVTPTELTIINCTVEPQRNMNYSTAGLYILKYGNSNCTTAANLIVIRNGPLCGCDTKTLKLLCLVDFAEYPNQPNHPVFTWRDGTGRQLKQETPNFVMITAYVKRSQSRLQITSISTMMYECQLTFSAASQFPLKYVATNAPDFTASCFTPCG